MPNFVQISLTEKETQCLLEHAVKASLIRATLETSMTEWIVSNASEVAVYCTEKAAHDLLDIAKDHCASAVRKIEQALKRAE